MELHPKILEKNGKKEFERIEDELSDYEDLQDLREAKQSEGDIETRSLTAVRRELKI